MLVNDYFKESVVVQVCSKYPARSQCNLCPVHITTPSILHRTQNWGEINVIKQMCLFPHECTTLGAKYHDLNITSSNTYL